MVAKLVKHQLRDDMRVMPFLCGAVLVLGALILVLCRVSAPVAALISALYMMLAGGGQLVVFVIIAMRYHRTMFGDEGYLTQALPVKQGHLFAAKSAIGFAELLVYTLCLLFAVGVMLAAVSATAGQSIFAMFSPEANPVYYVFSPPVVALFVMVFMIQSAEQLMMVFLAVTVTNTRPFQRFSAAIAPALFVGLYIVNSAITTALSVAVPVALRIGESGVSLEFTSMLRDLLTQSTAIGMTTHYMPVMGLGGVCFELLAIVAMYIINVRMLNRSVIVR